MSAWDTYLAAVASADLVRPEWAVADAAVVRELATAKSRHADMRAGAMTEASQLEEAAQRALAEAADLIATVGAPQLLPRRVRPTPQTGSVPARSAIADVERAGQEVAKKVSDLRSHREGSRRNRLAEADEREHAGQVARLRESQRLRRRALELSQANWDERAARANRIALVAAIVVGIVMAVTALSVGIPVVIAGAPVAAGAVFLVLRRALRPGVARPSEPI